MRVRARIATVDPEPIEEPATCPYEGCGGQHFKLHEGRVTKPLRDSRLARVTAQRWKCLRCGRTHRVYPRGVSRAQHSDRLKSISILFYVLGISYRGVEDLLSALGFPIDHSTVYSNVQAAGEQVRRLRQTWLQRIEGKVAVVGGDLTFIECHGEMVAVAVGVDATSGITLDIEVLGDATTETLTGWLQPLLDLVDAEVLLSDDQDGFKAVADAASVSQQICRQHVTRNVLDFVAQAADSILTTPPSVPEGLAATPDQLLEDLLQLEWIMLGQPEKAQEMLGELYDRYAQAPAPVKGKRATVWYRMRNHVLRLWNHWPRYVCYQKRAQAPFKIEETNNVTERTIGWNLKERYRTMRGYKRSDSIKNVGMLTAWLREEPAARDMSALFVR
jgi:transposase-like protein